MTPHGLWSFLEFRSVFRTCRQNNISSVFTFAVVTAYHLHLQIKMVTSISKVSQLWMQISWEPEVILKNSQPCSFLFYQKFMEFFRISLWKFLGLLPQRGTCCTCIRGCVYGGLNSNPKIWIHWKFCTQKYWYHAYLLPKNMGDNFHRRMGQHKQFPAFDNTH